MKTKDMLKGVMPAVATPFGKNNQPHLENLQDHIRTLAEEGCHGILLAGSTGEGPSLGLGERQAVFEAGVEASGEMIVIAGTGCASLDDTLTLTRKAFEVGADAALVVPPFYFKNLSHGGLLSYFRRLFEAAVPQDGLLLLYHIPQVSHVAISFDLLESLLHDEPERLAGVKDSSGDPGHLNALCTRFPGQRILVGDDRLLLAGLQQGAAGCITAAANVFAPLNLAVYRAYQDNQHAEALQAQLSSLRNVLERHLPFPPTIKALLALRYAAPGWQVRPPLEPLSKEETAALRLTLRQAGAAAWAQWLE